MHTNLETFISFLMVVLKTIWNHWALVVHACNPRYQEAEVRRIAV
jgi:hypothetical protein